MTRKQAISIKKHAAGNSGGGFFGDLKNKAKATVSRVVTGMRDANHLREMANLPIPDAASQYLGNALYGDEGVKWVKENQGLANALTFIGIPSLIGMTAWGLGSLGSKKPVSPWPYLLPFAALGGTAWWLSKDHKLKSLLNTPLATTSGASTGSTQGNK